MLPKIPKYILICILFAPRAIKPEVLVVSSVPKSGTQLLHKTVSLITGKQESPLSQTALFTPSYPIIFDFIKNNPNSILLTHIIYEQRYEILFRGQWAKLFFIYRDPRDQLISRVFYTYAYPDTFSGLQHLSFNELLLAFIGHPSEPIFDDILRAHVEYKYPPKGQYISNIKSFYAPFLPWIKNKHCCSVRFEDLVGSKGDGSDEKQEKELIRLASHINRTLTRTEIDHITAYIFGRNTFREGKIGSWKKYFTDEHKAAFKAVAGDLLIDLGYEKDYNW